MKQVNLKVLGMSCGHCVNSIEGSIGDLNGVKEVSVQLKEGMVDITYNPELINVDLIKGTIEEQGYEVT